MANGFFKGVFLLVTAFLVIQAFVGRISHRKSSPTHRWSKFGFLPFLNYSCCNDDGENNWKKSLLEEWTMITLLKSLSWTNSKPETFTRPTHAFSQFLSILFDYNLPQLGFSDLRDWNCGYSLEISLVIFHRSFWIELLSKTLGQRVSK